MAKFFNKSFKEYTDSGFSSSSSDQGRRILNKDGSFNVKKTGLGFFERNSLFHFLIQISWINFFLIIFVGFVLFNGLFTLFYWLDRSQLTGLNTNSTMEEVVDLFAFSVQTFTSVGYGRVNPVGIFANFLASFEAMIGLFSFAIGTGLLYGRFSKPVSNIIYTENGLISPYQDKTAFMFRMANSKKNQLIEVEAELMLSCNMTEDGKTVRKFFILEVERKKINFLSLSWTVVHPLDEKSPLYGFTKEDFEKAEVEFIVLINGFDDTFEQTVHSRQSYKFNEIVWNAKFDLMYSSSSNNNTTILHLDKLNLYHLV